jgi:hypothetical protein
MKMQSTPQKSSLKQELKKTYCVTSLSSHNEDNIVRKENSHEQESIVRMNKKWRHGTDISPSAALGYGRGTKSPKNKSVALGYGEGTESEKKEEKER